MNKYSYVKMNRGKTMKKVYKIEVDCANCANKMELAANKVEGVKEAGVNFMALKMNVEFEEGADEKAVMKKVLKACRKVESDCEIYF
jgi:copper chaperone CopZ